MRELQKYGRKRVQIALSVSTVLASGLASPVAAQSQTLQPGSIPPPPVRRAVDGNGVDVIQGTFNRQQPSLTIGSGDAALSYGADNMGQGWVSSLRAGVILNGNTYIVTVLGRSNSFTQQNGVFVATEGDGSTLTSTNTGMTYTARDGTVAQLAFNSSSNPFWDAGLARVVSVTAPSGQQTYYNWKTTPYCPGGMEQADNGGKFCPSGMTAAVRLQSITNSNGYQLKLAYASNTLDDTSIGQSYDDWSRLTSVKGINNGVEYCNPTADICTLAVSWPVLTFSTTVNGYTVTDPLSRATSYPDTFSGSTSVFRIKRPGASVPNVVATTDGIIGSNKIISVTREGVTYAYAYSDSGTIRTTKVTDPTGGTKVYTSDTSILRILSYKDETNRTTTYAYDASGRLTKTTYPEGNSVEYAYDARGNIVRRAIHAKPGSGLPDLVTSASYPATCTNPVICNKPTSLTDANGNVYSFAYDPAHGGVTSATLPPPSSGAPAPQTRYSYARFSASFLGASGTLVSGAPQYRLTSTSTCKTGVAPACVGTADEVVTTTGYGASGSPSNLLPVSRTVAAGNGDATQTATGSVGYDAVGNVQIVTNPLGAQTRYSYDAARQLLVVAGPDPDGTGPLRNRAVRYSYNLDGQVLKVEQGATSGETDAALAAFSTLQQSVATYDANARQASQALQSSTGTTYSLAQFSFDTLGRLDCAAVRMDPAQWAGQVASCVPQTTGPNGADRVSRTAYDAAGRVVKVTRAYGTSDASDDLSASYTPNGLKAAVVDANGNRTSYVYDGYDRLSEAHYPTPGNGAVSSTTDYEGLTYDANGNVLSRRLRDGQSISYVYDALNRLTQRNMPLEPSTGLNRNSLYAYDNFNRLSSFGDAQGNVTAWTFIYDALGRVTSESLPFNGAFTSTYDAAGRRTKIAWPDGFFVTYQYDATGATTAILENGITSLAQFGYDDLGRRTTLNRGNGVRTSYGYDQVSRLSSLALSYPDTSKNESYSYGYNPAGQITTRTGTNDAYAFNGLVNVDRPYSANGLNQYTQSGSRTLSYDGRGNLTSDGTTSWVYNVRNLLTGYPGGNAYYDPLDRLFDVTVEGTWAMRSGANVLSEVGYDMQLKRRYVPGPGTDETLVWYEGAGLTDKRFLAADERGSIVTVSNSAGTTLAINSFDEYGIPAAGNLGRFQYTGQRWMPGLGMYDYKARIYSPTLGRFMQTDPIGYGDGPSWYNYAHSDPINRSDPLGLADPNVTPPVDSKPNSQNGQTGDPPQPSDIIVTGERPQPVSDYNIGGTINTIVQISFDLANLPQPGEIVVTAQLKRQPYGPILPSAQGRCGRQSDVTDATLYALGAAGTSADAATVFLGKAAFESGGPETPVGATLLFGAGIARGVSLVASAGSAGVNLYKGNYLGAAANLGGMVAGSFGSRLVSRALGLPAIRGDAAGAVDVAAGQAANGSTGC